MGAGGRALAASLPLPGVFALRFRPRLPLKIAGVIRPAASECNSVIDYVPWTRSRSLPGTRAWVRPLERRDGAGTARDAASCIARHARCFAIRGEERGGE